MATKAASKRLGKEYATMQKEPPPFIWALPEEKNILTWHYIIRGPPDCPYTGGEYHGVILFPSEYPFKPPGIKMLTPSGRFAPDKKICFSMSDFHPGSWNPAWSVATILTGLLSFMLSDEMTTGSMTTSNADKRAFAANSHAWNVQHKGFKEIFPEFCSAQMKDLPNMGEKERGKPDVPPPALIGLDIPPIALTDGSNPDGSRSLLAHPLRGGAPSGHGGTAGGDGRGWSDLWRKLIWEKWRWGVLIAVAVIVSRLSS